MIRFGTIGTGKIVHEFLEAAGGVKEFRLQAVYSRTLEKAGEMAEMYGAEGVCDSLERMAESRDIDAVYVASPNSCHFGQVKQMLEHGKHVLCEKPAVTNADQWKELLRLAEQKKVILLEAMRPSFDPGFQTIEKLLPELGTIRRATLQYSQYSSRYDAYKRGEILNAFQPGLSNGAIMDIGIYCIHGLVRLFGKPDRITSNSIFLDNGMEGIGTVVAAYPGMLAEVLYSKVTDSGMPSEIQGELGSMLIQTIQIPREIVIKFRKGESRTIMVEEPENNMGFEIAAFIEMIQGERDPEFYQKISVLELEVLDLARQDAGIRFPEDGGSR